MPRYTSKALISLAALSLTGSALAVAAGSTSATAAPTRDEGPQPAPLVQAEGTAVPGQYVVFLDESAPRSAVRASVRSTQAAGGEVEARFGNLRGYAADLSAAELDAVRTDPSVAFVAEDSVVTASATQSGATFGIDRIDQRSLPLSRTYTYSATGAGVRAYVIDTGINSSHSEFSGRLGAGYTAINDGRGTNDCNGHGTHVAGTVGGTTYGVAKQVTLIPVRVLDCEGSGTSSGVIAGMNWVAGQGGGAVANMSLGGPADSSTDAAVQRMTSAGITTVVAAGNENQNACNVSPARASSAITVGATTSSDARASFSNYGSCVDIFAPGQGITSAWIGGSSATNTISGTSMASPHVAGVAAQYLQRNPGASPATVTNALVAASTTNVVSGVNGSPNRLLFTSY